MEYSISDWQYEVRNRDTVLGFKEWQEHKLEQEQHVEWDYTCQTCGTLSVVQVCGKTSDLCCMNHLHREHDGYVLRGMGIGEEDYLEFSFCVNCGQIQGTWPKKIHGRIITKKTHNYSK